MAVGRFGWGSSILGIAVCYQRAFLSIMFNLIRFKQRFYAQEKNVAFQTKAALTELRYT